MSPSVSTCIKDMRTRRPPGGETDTGSGSPPIRGDADDGCLRWAAEGSQRQAHLNSGLWGLVFGNGLTGTPRDLLFAEGIDNYSHGLFGLIRPN